MEGTQRFYQLKKGHSAPSTCLSWIQKMKGLPSTEKSYPRMASATAEDPYDLSVEIP